MGDLLSFVIEHGPLGEPQSRIWCRQLALAVQYLHESGVAHRDVKCENILLSANFNVKLADFGFARYVTQKNRQVQMSTTFCGSFDYSAPELLKGKPYNPKASDIWALGVVLYMMLNKSIPFKGKTRQVYEQQMMRAWKFRSQPFKSSPIPQSSSRFVLLDGLFNLQPETKCSLIGYDRIRSLSSATRQALRTPVVRRTDIALPRVAFTVASLVQKVKGLIRELNATE
uniref:Protein kinase domain-containing protein n=1 Tax=Anopheles atroparvus TaxID=41427 RepID=A0A182IRM5_ANOAO